MASTSRVLDLDAINVSPISFLVGRSDRKKWSERTLVFNTIDEACIELQKPNGNLNHIVDGFENTRFFMDIETKVGACQMALDMEFRQVDYCKIFSERLDDCIGKVKEALSVYLPKHASFDYVVLTCHRQVAFDYKFSAHIIFPNIAGKPKLFSILKEDLLSKHGEEYFANLLDFSVWGCSKKPFRAYNQQIAKCEDVTEEVVCNDGIHWDCIPFKAESLDNFKIADTIITFVPCGSTLLSFPDDRVDKIVSRLHVDDTCAHDASTEANYTEGNLRQVMALLPTYCYDEEWEWKKTLMSLASAIRELQLPKKCYMELAREFSARSEKYNEAKDDKTINYLWNQKRTEHTFGSLIWNAQKTPEGRAWYEAWNEQRFRQEQGVVENEGYQFVEPDRCEFVDRKTVASSQYYDEVVPFDPNDTAIINRLPYSELKRRFELKFCRIENPICIVEMTDDGNVNFISFEDCKKRFMNISIAPLIKDGSVQGEDKRVYFLDRWLHDPLLRTYSRTDFCPPPIKCAPNVFNLWSGFAVEKIPPFSGDPNELAEINKGLDMILWHLKEIVCSGCEKSYKFVLDWHAHIFQKPGDKMRCMIMSYGRKRCGKDVIAEECLKHMIGEHMYFQTANIKDDLLSKHSDGLMHRLFITIDEIYSGDTYSLGSKWKDMITSLVAHHEPKGHKKVQYNNRARFWGTANQLNSIPEVDKDEMRVFLLECSAAKRGQSAYFIPFIKKLNDPNVQRAFYDYLMKVEITTDFDDIEQRPMTNPMRDICGLNLHYYEQWLAHFALSQKLNVDNSTDRGIIKLTGPELWEVGRACNNPEEMKKIDFHTAKFPVKKQDFLAKMRHMQENGVKYVASNGFRGYIIDVQEVLNYVNQFNVDIGLDLVWDYQRLPKITS